MSQSPSIEHVFALAQELPLVDRMRLIERLIPQMTRELQASPASRSFDQPISTQSVRVDTYAQALQVAANDIAQQHGMSPEAILLEWRTRLQNRRRTGSDTMQDSARNRLERHIGAVD